MKKIVIIGSTFVLVVGLAGCTLGDNIPGTTIAGTAAGGLLGAEFFHGERAWIGILGSALVGSVIVNLLGNEWTNKI
ncbi:glycine zipper 2TM domain-containing protein [Coxiella-like endosymbiont of Rhipicephalus sanguineus]|uniref:glycine zipper 2TM domain-containing protein n=1 Tax=Coxiella-like endosymbiont of Rhipicephalus sanguineus TaxID=1955402 RepID=UPI00255AE039|nr:glycine zipper 2TM domain-containing protein [Coxiella-like endosymbiont of Rhipicephalus sanguineus]